MRKKMIGDQEGMWGTCMLFGPEKAAVNGAIPLKLYFFLC